MIFRNSSPHELDLPTLDLRVAAGETVEVTGDAAKSLHDNPFFERVDKPKPRTADTEES